MHFLPSLKGPGFSSTSPARMSSMASIGPTKFGEISEGCFIPVLWRLSIDSNFSDATTRRTDTRRTGGKMQAAVSRHGRLLRSLLLLLSTMSRVSSKTKGRKWFCGRVWCSFLFFTPLDGSWRRRRISGLPIMNPCQRPMVALHWFTSIPIVGLCRIAKSGIYNSIKL